MPDYPALALTNGVEEGRVTLLCVVNPDGALSDCQIADETPADNGFGQSALAAAARARLSRRTVDTAADGARVRFGIRYVSPTAVPEAPVASAKLPNIPVPPAQRTDRLEYLPPIVPVPPAPLAVEWVTPPVVEFPERALSRGIESARVALQCRVGKDGLPLDCDLVYEDPAGAGFGPAALRAMPDARVSPRIPVGSFIRFTINFATTSEPSADQPALPAPAS